MIRAVKNSGDYHEKAVMTVSNVGREQSGIMLTKGEYARNKKDFEQGASPCLTHQIGLANQQRGQESRSWHATFLFFQLLVSPFRATPCAFPEKGGGSGVVMQKTGLAGVMTHSVNSGGSLEIFISVSQHIKAINHKSIDINCGKRLKDHAGAKIISDTQITLGRTLQDFGGAATKIWDHSPTFYPLIQREVQALEN